MNSSLFVKVLDDYLSTLKQKAGKLHSLESPYLQHLEQLSLSMTQGNLEIPTGAKKTKFLSEHSLTIHYLGLFPSSFKMDFMICSICSESNIISTLTIVTTL